MKTTPEDVAAWMRRELESEAGYLSQADAAAQIDSHFGDEFVYTNENGNLAISRKVLAAFKKLTATDVVWDRRERAWRKRDPDDPEGRRQTD